MIPNLVNDLSWNIDDPNSMVVTIKYKGEKVFHFSMYEAIESCSRRLVLKHIRECDNSPWLKRWNDEKHEEVVNKLKGIK